MSRRDWALTFVGWAAVGIVFFVFGLLLAAHLGAVRLRGTTLDARLHPEDCPAIPGVTNE